MNTYILLVLLTNGHRKEYKINDKNETQAFEIICGIQGDLNIEIDVVERIIKI